jgi:hypothetical protein
MINAMHEKGNRRGRENLSKTVTNVVLAGTRADAWNNFGAPAYLLCKFI